MSTSRKRTAEDRPAPPCYTVARLRAIRPGQRIVYYTGHLEHDLRRSEDGTSRTAPAMKYAATLRALIEASMVLWQEGRCKVITQKVVRRTPVYLPGGGIGYTQIPVTEYIAEGV